MQHITLEEVKAGCRREYEAKTLLFQNFTGSYGYEIRTYNGGLRVSHCAIGTVLNQESLDAIDLGSLQTIILNIEDSEMSASLRKVVSWNENEEEELFRIQKLHDGLCEPSGLESTSEFLTAIDYVA